MHSIITTDLIPANVSMYIVLIAIYTKGKRTFQTTIDNVTTTKKSEQVAADQLAAYHATIDHNF